MLSSLRSRSAALCWAAALLASAVSAVSAAPSFFVWHITDVHVDPWYTVGSDAKSCYCETTAKCQVTGAHCGMSGSAAPTSALRWGNSEGNCVRSPLFASAPPPLPPLAPDPNLCSLRSLSWGARRQATPHVLYSSAVTFMAATKRTPLVYFTGDFAEAGASSPCHGDAAATAQRQILDIIAWDWATLKAALPKAKVYGSLGNHDSVPVRIPASGFGALACLRRGCVRAQGDVYYGGNAGGNGSQSWEYNNLTAQW